MTIFKSHYARDTAHYVKDEICLQVFVGNGFQGYDLVVILGVLCCKKVDYDVNQHQKVYEKFENADLIERLHVEGYHEGR